MRGPHDLAQTFADLTAELLAHERREPTARGIVDHAVATLPGADFASLTVPVRGGRDFATVASTHETATTCDELQYSLGEGPCVEATSRRRASHCDDLVAERRWPQWSPQAAAAGVGSVLSLALVQGERPLGALNLYAARPAAFADPGQVHVAEIFAQHAAAALAAATQISGLDSALESRHLIGLAQGILMERFGLGVDGAFRVLQRYSSTSNVKLRDVAAHLVETRSLPDETASDREG